MSNGTSFSTGASLTKPTPSSHRFRGARARRPDPDEARGIDPEEWTGLAFGFGIDRCAQVRHDMDDLRHLLTNDFRFLKQF